MWGIVIALVSGALMSLQGIFNTEVTKQTSICRMGTVYCSDHLHPVLVFF